MPGRLALLGGQRDVLKRRRQHGRRGGPGQDQGQRGVDGWLLPGAGRRAVGPRVTQRCRLWGRGAVRASTLSLPATGIQSESLAAVAMSMNVGHLFVMPQWFGTFETYVLVSDRRMSSTVARKHTTNHMSHALFSKAEQVSEQAKRALELRKAFPSLAARASLDQCSEAVQH